MKRQNLWILLLTCAAWGTIGMQPATHLWAPGGGAAATAVSEVEEKRATFAQNVHAELAHSDFLEGGLKEHLIQEEGFPSDFAKEAFYAFFRDDAFQHNLRLAFEEADQRHDGFGFGATTRVPGYRGGWLLAMADALQKALGEQVGQERWDQITGPTREALLRCFVRAINPIEDAVFGQEGLLLCDDRHVGEAVYFLNLPENKQKKPDWR